MQILPLLMSIAIALTIATPAQASCQQGGWCPNPERGSAGSTLTGGNK
jgi:hypothetical protein